MAAIHRVNDKVNDKQAEMAKEQANFKIAGEYWEFDDLVHLIDYPCLAQWLVKIACDKEKIPKLEDFYSRLGHKYGLGGMETEEKLRKEMAKLPVLASRNFRVTNDFCYNLNSFFSLAVFSKNYKDLSGVSSRQRTSVISYYLLRGYFLFSEGESLQNKFDKLNLPKDKVKLTWDGNLEILLNDGEMIFQGFSEVDLAKEKLILMSRSKSFINEDFIRSIKLLNKQEKEKKSLSLGVEYKNQGEGFNTQEEK